MVDSSRIEVSAEDAQELIELAEIHIAKGLSANQWIRLEELLDRKANREYYLNYMAIHAHLGDALRESITFSFDPVARSVKETSKPVYALFYIGLVGCAIAAVVVLAGSYWRGWDLRLRTGIAADSQITKGLVSAQSHPQPVVLEGNEKNSPREYSSQKYVPYDRSEVPVRQIAFRRTAPEDGPLSRTVSTSIAARSCDLANGERLRLGEFTHFGITSEDSGVIFSGIVDVEGGHQNSHYAIDASNLRISGQGSDFRVSILSDSKIKVDALYGETSITRRNRQPVFHWSFDALDRGSETSIQQGLRLNRVSVVDGLLGRNSLSFENVNESHVVIEQGIGSEVGRGGFACSSGISVEVLISSRWSGMFGDYDEIFRKEDGNYRMVLSFQHDDDSFRYSVPKVAKGPCLSFGLHLDGLGYSELEVPLDGQQGRPTLQSLTNGSVHHIVATYDSFQGHKCIYIDGNLMASYFFPSGALILNGGAAHAEIGNHWGGEPFTGCIDEFSFYDFALTAPEILEHSRNSKLGIPWSHERVIAPSDSDRWQQLLRIGSGESVLITPGGDSFEKTRDK